MTRGHGWVIFYGAVLSLFGIILFTLSLLKKAYCLILWLSLFLVVIILSILIGCGILPSGHLILLASGFIIYASAYDKKVVTPWLEKIIFQRETRESIAKFLRILFK